MKSSKRCIDRKDFEWTLKNLANHPEGKIEGVLLSAGNPRHSLCYVQLHVTLSKTGQQALSHQLVFLEGSYEKGYTYKVYVVSKGGKIKQLPLFNPIIRNCHFLERKYFTEGSVTLRCRLTFPKESYEHTAHIEDLSMRIGTLRDRKDFSDLELHTGGEVFYVHKDLLEKRCPALIKHIGLERKEKRKKVSISRPVLEAILRYVYTGKFNNLPAVNHQEFYKMAEVCQFEEFTKEIYNISPHATLCTEIRVIKKNIFFDINVKDVVGGKGVFKSVHVGSTRFLLKASIGKLDRGTFMHIDIHCKSALEEPILLNCNASIELDTNDLETHPEVRLQFSNDIEKHLKYVCNKKLQKDSRLQLTLSIALSKGENTCLVQGKDLQSKIRRVSGAVFPLPDFQLQSVFGMSLLSLHLEELYFMESWKGDVNIQFSDGQLKAHRAILAASSPLFRQMLINMPGNMINLDMGIKSGRILLEKIYGGEVTQTQVTKFISNCLL